MLEKKNYMHKIPEIMKIFWKRIKMRENRKRKKDMRQLLCNVLCSVTIAKNEQKR